MSIQHPIWHNTYNVNMRKQTIVAATTASCESKYAIKFLKASEQTHTKRTIDRDFLPISANIMRKVWGTTLDDEWDNT